MREQQEKVYLIQYRNTGKQDYIRTTKVLVSGRIYFNNNNELFTAIRKVSFKYSLDDIRNLRAILEEYNVGSVQHMMFLKLDKIYKSQIPSIRFTSEEKEILEYIYYTDHDIHGNCKNTLKKVLGIKD